MSKKPLGIKNYGSIPHLPNSRLGPSDKQCSEGHARIATQKTRDKHDLVFVQEKLDGSNVGVARIDGVLYPLGRAGYKAISSPHKMHHDFHNWVYQKRNYDRFMALLDDGERAVGEWLQQAHGTRYKLWHEPFVLFDIMQGIDRTTCHEVTMRGREQRFILPYLIHNMGGALSVNEAMAELGEYGRHGAIDPVEGVMYRVERNRATGKKGERKWEVDFLVKYVRPDKVDGCYLPKVSGEPPVWNWEPDEGHELKHNWRIINDSGM